MNSTQSQQPITSLDPTGHHFPSPPMASEHKLAKGKTGDWEGILLNGATVGQEKMQTKQASGQGARPCLLMGNDLPK